MREEKGHRMLPIELFAGKHGKRNTVIVFALAFLLALMVGKVVEYAIVRPACIGYGVAHDLRYAGYASYRVRQDGGVVCRFDGADAQSEEVPLSTLVPFMQSVFVDFTLNFELAIPMALLVLVVFAWARQRMIGGVRQR